MIRMSLGLPLMMLAAGAHAQLSPAAPGVSIETMDLGSIMALVRQQRSALQNADPGVQPQPQQQAQQPTQQQTKQEQQQLTKQEQERKEQLEQLEQKIKRQEQVKQEPASEEQAQQTKQQTKQQQTSKEQALKEQQQLANQEQQAKQEQQTKTGQQPQTKQEQKTTSQPARQQLLALLGSGNDKPAPVPTTTSDVTTYLASGQGNRDAQSQIVAPVVTVAAAGVGAPVAGGATTAGIGGLSAGGAVASTIAAALAAAATSSGDGGATVLSALQQQQQQSAATAAQQQAYSYVTANMVTPLASFPTTLRATYSGPVTGTASAGAGVTGTFQALVDFATIRGGAPSVPGSITFSNGLGGTTFTLTLLGGFVGGSMSGTYAGQAVTGFVMNGRFYGPAAEQLAGSWSMQNAGATLTGSGSFKAQR